DRDADDAEDHKAGHERARLEDAARQRVDGVAHPRRVRRVVPALEAEIVIAEVADHVGDDEADQQADEFGPGEAPGVGGEEAGDDRRLRGNDENDAARRIEKARNRVEAPHLLDARPVEAGKRPGPEPRFRDWPACLHAWLPACLVPFSAPLAPRGRAGYDRNAARGAMPRRRGYR